MKQLRISTICGFLLAGTALAMSSAYAVDSPAKSSVDVELRAIKITAEAEERAMAQCSETRIVVPVPYWDFLTNVERTVNRTVSIEWSGGCVDGKRDGNGVLTWTQEKEPNGRPFATNRAAPGPAQRKFGAQGRPSSDSHYRSHN